MASKYPVFNLSIHLTQVQPFGKITPGMMRSAEKLGEKLSAHLGRPIEIGTSPTGAVLFVGEWKSKATATKWTEKVYRWLRRSRKRGVIMSMKWASARDAVELWDQRDQRWHSLV